MLNNGSEDTLFAFIVEFSRKASIVNILGSWDNFQQPYPLQKDNRGGRTVWRRYSNFAGIICDGDRLKRAEESRDGCLKMGGTYWYYYQLDNDGEYCDQAAPTTRTCPFLPGQEVNVLEVPSKANESRFSSDSDSSDSAYTLDPNAKYHMHPGRMTKSAARRSGASEVTDQDGFLSEASPVDDRRDFGVAILPTVISSIMSKSRSSRKRTFSSEGPLSSENLQPSKRRMFSLRPSTTPASLQPRKRAMTPVRNLHTSTEAEMSSSRASSSWQRIRSLTSSSSKGTSKVTPSRPDPQGELIPGPPYGSLVSGQDVSFLSGADNLLRSRPGSRPGSAMQLTWGGEDGTDFFTSFSKTGLLSRSASKRAIQQSPSTEMRAFKAGPDHSNAASTRSSAFYPHFSSSNPYTETAFSVPTTPDSLTNLKIDELAPSGLADTTQEIWYQADRNTSVLTLQNVNKLPDDSALTPTGSKFQHEDSKNQRVKQWTSQVEDMSSDMEEICQEMSYLGAMIT